MTDEREGAVWMAAYPKSGNTWLRCLLEAYRRNGALDINDLRITSSDGGATILQGVSPIPINDLGFRGEMLIRPAAILNLLARLNKPTWVKTHFANIQPDGLPHCIPKELTEKAVYVVRDPRSVFLSLSKFFKFPLEKTADSMADKDFTIGGNALFARQFISSWSNHVSSWVSETEFPVHIVKYEDMMANAGKELTEVLTFLEQDVDPATIKRAVEATELSRLRKTEGELGFKEDISSGGFFNEGGTRWQDELGPKWIKRIEADHGDVMRAMGYIEFSVTELRAV